METVSGRGHSFEDVVVETVAGGGGQRLLASRQGQMAVLSTQKGTTDRDMAFRADQLALVFLLLAVASHSGVQGDNVDCRDLNENQLPSNGILNVFNAKSFLHLELSTHNGSLKSGSTYIKQAVGYSFGRQEENMDLTLYFILKNGGCQKSPWAYCDWYSSKCEQLKDNTFNLLVLAFDENYAVLYWGDIGAIDILARNSRSPSLNSFDDVPQALKAKINLCSNVPETWFSYTTVNEGEFDYSANCVERDL